MTTSASAPALHNIATQLRIDSVASTTAAGSGHPTTCLSAAEIVAALFFAEMRFDPKDPQHPDNDRFVLSKGHAAPILYAAWAEAGLFPRDELLKLRQFGLGSRRPSDAAAAVRRRRHRIARPGLCAGVGIALNARRIGSDYRTYVLLGDGETAEGSVWEAADVALLSTSSTTSAAIIDVNALGQSRPTQFEHDMDAIAARWTAFGWHAIVVDGHDIEALLDALRRGARAPRAARR